MFQQELTPVERAIFDSPSRQHRQKGKRLKQDFP